MKDESCAESLWPVLDFRRACSRLKLMGETQEEKRNPGEGFLRIEMPGGWPTPVPGTEAAELTQLVTRKHARISTQPDGSMVIVDLKLPERDGLEILKELSSRPVRFLVLAPEEGRATVLVAGPEIKLGAHELLELARTLEAWILAFSLDVDEETSLEKLLLRDNAPSAAYIADRARTLIQAIQVIRDSELDPQEHLPLFLLQQDAVLGASPARFLRECTSPELHRSFFEALERFLKE